MGRQDSQNGPVYGSTPAPPTMPGQPAGRAAVPPAGGVYGRASVPPGGRPVAPVGPVPQPVVTGRSRRVRTLTVSAVVVLILAALAAVTFVVRPGPVKGWLGGGGPATAPAPRVVPEPAPSPVLVAAEGTAPSAAGIKAALDPLVASKSVGTEVNVSIVDPATGQALYEHNADILTTPASTTKLLTAAAVLAARGPAYRLSTRAVAGAKPGEVVLVGGGDPTLAISATNQQFPGSARLDQLAAQVKAALGAVTPTRVVIDTTLFTGPATALGWDPADISPGGQVAKIQSLMTNAGRIKPVHHEVGADPRYADPAMAAGKAFARQLGVTAPVTRAKAPAAPASAASAAPEAITPGKELGKVQSPPLVHVIDWMMQQSDNVIAENMGRQVALAAGKPATFDGAAAAIVAKLGELGLGTDEANLYDASGLSRHNDISPKTLTDVLTLAAGGKQPAVSGLFEGLPVAGWSGTLRTRFVTPRPNRVGQGIVRAKTGSLRGVNTMAGALITKDGRLLVFAIMANGSGDVLTARAGLDKIAARLVACGC